MSKLSSPSPRPHSSNTPLPGERGGGEGKKSFLSGPLAGAAFLMATSAIGPGFITQTTKFTEQIKGSFGFVILISVLLTG